MKFELVEFYEYDNYKKLPNKMKRVGTVNIYLIDCEMDIRGICVNRKGNQLFLEIPHFCEIDKETGDLVRFPFISFTDEKIQKEMKDFLNLKVKPEIKRRLKIPEKEEAKEALEEFSKLTQELNI